MKSSIKMTSNKSGMLYTTKQPGGTRGK
jgi:hypothetical protein